MKHSKKIAALCTTVLPGGFAILGVLAAVSPTFRKEMIDTAKSLIDKMGSKK